MDKGDKSLISVIECTEVNTDSMLSYFTEKPKFLPAIIKMFFPWDYSQVQQFVLQDVDIS